MSMDSNFSALDSVDAALGLVAERDVNPELDRQVYGDSPDNIEIQTQQTFPQTQTQNQNPTPTSIPIQTQTPTQPQNQTPQIVNDGKKEVDPPPFVTKKSNQNNESFVTEANIEKPNLYINPSIHPPNNGSMVTSIDQLVDPLKLRNLLSMFSSVPHIKSKIEPSKFDSVNNRGSPSPTSSLTPSPTSSPIETSPLQTPLLTTSPVSSPVPSTQNTAIIQPKIVIVEPIIEILDTANIVEDRPEINQGWSVMDIVTKAIPPGWTDVFHAAVPEFEHINKSLIEDESQHGRFYPLRKNLFKTFDMCPLNNVKVVIVGQDPYHSDDHNGYPIAMGMSFSVPRGVQIPPSLRNIYKELDRSIENWTPPSHGDLTPWVKQGVLLLNTCLTVRPHQAKSHKSLWMGFIAKVIATINKKNPHCIFVMWGREAEKIGNLLTNKNITFTAPHPSGLSAHRGFIGCDHFVKINKELEKQGKNPIDWTL